MLKGNSIKPVSICFTEKWNSKNLGVDYSELAWSAPIRRTEILREVDRMIYDRFGDVGLGDRDPEPFPNIMAYGHRFMAALFGCEIYYIKDQAPCAIHLEADFEDMARLEVPDFEKSPVIKRAFSEVDILRRHYGFCKGEINIGSPLNVAVSVFGEKFLLACAMKPEIARHVLRVISKTELKVYHELQAVIEPEKYPHDNFTFPYGNCPAVMISPDMYRNVVLPEDKWIRNQVPGFLLHHCGVFDRYIDLYKELNPTFIDIGGGSDYRAIRKAFPEITFSMIINPPDFENKSSSEIDELVGDMVEKAAPADKISTLWTADFSEDICDDVLRALATVHERI